MFVPILKKKKKEK